MYNFYKERNFIQFSSGNRTRIGFNRYVFRMVICGMEIDMLRPSFWMLWHYDTPSLLLWVSLSIAQFLSVSP